MRGYENYRNGHQEQLHLINTGSFVASLAATMAKLPLTASLIFEGTKDHHRAWASGFQDPTELTEATPSLLLTWVIESCYCTGSSLSLRQIEHLELGAELLPAKILTELPITLHKTGVRLRRLDIRVFPSSENCVILRPFKTYKGDENVVTTSDRQLELTTPGPAWEDLRAASQNLEVFWFGQRGIKLEYNRCEVRPSGKSSDCVDAFLSCVLSSPVLEDLSLNMAYFRQTVSLTSRAECYPLGSVLDGLPELRNIRYLGLSRIQVKGRQLARFLRKLGSKLEMVKMNAVELAGQWEVMEEILKEKLTAKPWPCDPLLDENMMWRTYVIGDKGYLTCGRPDSTFYYDRMIMRPGWP